MGSPEYIEYPDRRSMVQALLEARAAGVSVETMDGFRMLHYPDGAPKAKSRRAKKEIEEVEAEDVETEDTEDLIGE